MEAGHAYGRVGLREGGLAAEDFLAEHFVVVAFEGALEVVRE